MNTRGEEDEDVNLKCFKKHRNVINYIGTFITNQCIRVNNWKFKLILKPKDGSLLEFQKKSRKEEIVEKLKELVQLLKDE